MHEHGVLLLEINPEELDLQTLGTGRTSLIYTESQTLPSYHCQKITPFYHGFTTLSIERKIVCTLKTPKKLYFHEEL